MNAIPPSITYEKKETTPKCLIRFNPNLGGEGHL